MLDFIKKLIFTGLLIFSLCVRAEAAAQISSFVYQASPAHGNSVWLLNTETGALSFCTALSNSTKPVCTPWGKPPTSSASYRYAPGTKKLIPLNQKARDEQKKHDPLSIR